MRGHLFKLAAILILGLACRVRAAAPTPSTTDLWDVSNGAIITATSSAMTPDARTLLGLSMNVGGELNDAYFGNGAAPGFAHYVEFRTVNPVTIRSFTLYAGDDRSSGNTLRRSFSNFGLYGWNGSSYVQLFNRPVALPYTNQQDVIGALIFWEEIPVFTSDKWRAEFTQPAPYLGFDYGPRVIELDGYSQTPEPSTALLACGVIMILGRRRRNHISR